MTKKQKKPDPMNDIALNSLQLAELYGSKLVILETTGSNITEVKPPEQWKLLGENKKNVLIVVDYADAFFLPDDVFSFLTNILTACKLGLADVAIYNINGQTDFESRPLIQHLKTTRTLLFGIEPDQIGLPMNFPEFQVQVFAGCTYLHAPSLDQCMNDKNLKGKLWVILKKVFNLP